MQIRYLVLHQAGGATWKVCCSDALVERADPGSLFLTSSRFILCLMRSLVFLGSFTEILSTLDMRSHCLFHAHEMQEGFGV